MKYLYVGEIFEMLEFFRLVEWLFDFLGFFICLEKVNGLMRDS